MPSGPRGRGCDGCRRQKKKCDMAQPACSRCQRLEIRCIGVGKQRIRFMVQELSKQGYKASAAPTIKFSRAPSNESTRLVQALVTKIRPTDDYRHWIVWQYGPFMDELPKRLGRSHFLDAAVQATVEIHTESCLQGNLDDPSAPAAKAYFNALAALRTTLDDPLGAASTDTLCGVMLLIYAHSRFEGDLTKFWSPHGNGLLNLLRLRQSCQNLKHLRDHLVDFEDVHRLRENYGGSRHYANMEDCRMFMALPAILLQSLANPDVVLIPEEYQNFEDTVSGDSPTATGLRHLCNLAELYAACRSAVADGATLEPYLHRSEALQAEIQELLNASLDRWTDFEGAAPQSKDALLEIVNVRFYGIALTIYILTICLRRVLQPSDEDVQADAKKIVHHLNTLWPLAQKYMPLGASWLSWALMCAWCATRGMPQRKECETALLRYLRAARGQSAVLPTDEIIRLESRLWLGRLG